MKKFLGSLIQVAVAPVAGVAAMFATGGGLLVGVLVCGLVMRVGAEIAE